MSSDLRSVLRTAAACAAFSVVLFPAGVVNAAFPGANGKIAFVSNRTGDAEIFVMNADGTDQTNVSNHPGDDSAPSWSPDGSRIVFVSGRTGVPQIFVMNADGSGQTNLSNNPANDASPSWSPDGSRIAFTRDCGTRCREVWVMNADGSSQTVIVPDTAPGFPTYFTTAWSPDGAKIAVTRSVSDSQTEIDLVNPNGTGLTPLTANGVNTRAPNWMPDGGSITYDRGGPGAADVFTMNADGSGQVNLTNAGGQIHESPSASPDGTKIVFNSWRHGEPEIYVMNIDGSGQTRLTNNTARDFDPDWQPIAGLGGARLVVGAAAPTTLYPGDTFSAPITIEQANHLYAAQAACQVNQAIVAPVSAAFGTFFDPVQRLIGANQVNAANGTWLGAISQQRPAEDLTGNGPFATLNMSAVAAGTSTVACTPLFADRDGVALPAASGPPVSVTVLPFAIIEGRVQRQGRAAHGGTTVTAAGPITIGIPGDTQGSFRFETLRAGSYHVEAASAGYLPVCADLSLGSGEFRALGVVTAAAGDANNDGNINIADATLLGANFGLGAPPADLRADLNGDAIVDVLDLALLGGNYGRSGCQAWQQ